MLDAFSDVSLAIPVREFDLFSSTTATLTSEMSEFLKCGMGLYMGTRFVAESGGGITAMNSSSDAVVVDLACLHCGASLQWLDYFFTELVQAGVNHCCCHLGKAHFKHALFHESLTSSQRKEFSTVLQTYDPQRLFDGGRVKFADIYSLN